MTVLVSFETFALHLRSFHLLKLSLQFNQIVSVGHLYFVFFSCQLFWAILVVQKFLKDLEKMKCVPYLIPAPSVVIKAQFCERLCFKSEDILHSQFFRGFI